MNLKVGFQTIITPKIGFQPVIIPKVRPQSKTQVVGLYQFKSLFSALIKQKTYTNPKVGFQAFVIDFQKSSFNVYQFKSRF